VESFLISTGVVALAEVGDKTQLLSFVLAARFRRSVPIILGILVATLANHAMAGGIGAWFSELLSAEALGWILGVSFLAMAIWMLIPDELDAVDTKLTQLGVFGTTVVAFFVAEMGDKTQIATVALAAQYPDLVAVVAGTTLGMMLANVPAVIFGERVVRRVSVRLVHGVSAVIFAALGIVTLYGVWQGALN
jgi:putative Ca2+/H+ antiporter (TMEM165/GDT1 family)